MKELITITDLVLRLSAFMLKYRHTGYNTIKVNKDYEVKLTNGSGIGDRALLLDKKGKIKFSALEELSPIAHFQTSNILNSEVVDYLEKNKHTELDAR